MTETKKDARDLKHDEVLILPNVKFLYSYCYHCRLSTLVQEAFFQYHLFLLGNLRRDALIEALSREKGKPLVKIAENLTFMLAQHLTAVKDPSNHMTRRAIENILQSETTVKS